MSKTYKELKNSSDVEILQILEKPDSIRSDATHTRIFNLFKLASTQPLNLSLPHHHRGWFWWQTHEYFSGKGFIVSNKQIICVIIGLESYCVL